MTFGDLWKSIDWSVAEMEEEGWLNKHKGDPTDQEFKTKFRMTLVEQALFGSAEQKEEAKYLLHMAGVWPQIVAFLRLNNLIEEKPDGPDRADRHGGEAVTQEGVVTAGWRVGGGDAGRDNDSRQRSEASTDSEDITEGA